MNTKSTRRLRLECLETRRVLSAVALPPLPLFAPTPPPVVPDDYRIGEHHEPLAIVFPDAQTAVLLPSGILTSTPDSSPSEQGDSTDAAVRSHGNPTRAPDQTSPQIADSYEQGAVGNRFIDVAPQVSILRTNTTTILASFSPSAAIETSRGIAESSEIASGQYSQVVGQVASITFVVVNVNPTKTKLPIDGASITESTYDGFVAQSSAVTVGVLLPPHGITGERNTSPPLTFHFPPQPLSSDEVDTNVQASVYSADSPQFVGVIDPIEGIPARHVPADPRMIRVSDPSIPVSVPNDTSPPVVASPPTVKVHSPDLPQSSDPSRTSDPTVFATVSSPPATSGMAIPPATNVALFDTATSSSAEGGLIALNDASVATSQIANTPSRNVSLQGTDTTALDRGIWLTDALPGLQASADFAGHNNKTAHSSENRVDDGSSRRASAVVRSIADSSEGGGIELAISTLSSVAAGDDSLYAAESAVNNSDQQVSDNQPEGGVGLFCDIEVSVAPTLPVGSSAAVESLYPDAAALITATESHGQKASPATQLMQPLVQSTSRSTMAGLASPLPMLLGVAVLVSRGGLRLEEKVPERERRLRTIENLRQSPVR